MTLVCGIDEAGRGPVIGPMVMAGVLVEEENLPGLHDLGVRDSKLLTPRRRKELFSKITAMVKQYSILIIKPMEIDAALNNPNMNLNWLEAYNSAKIINSLKPEKAFIDSPSNNCEKYKRYLRRLLRDKKIELVVEHKADLNYIQCSAASILAKVSRDEEIEKLKKHVGSDFGSGYLTDSLTDNFLKENFMKHPEIFRRSWIPYKKLVDGKNQRKLGDFKGKA